MFEDRWAGNDRSDDVAGGPEAAKLWRDSVGVAAVMMLSAEPLAGRSSGQLLELLAGWERQAAWLAAQQTRLIASIAQHIRADFARDRREAEERDLPVVFSDRDVENDIEAEVGTTLRLSSRTAASRVQLAEELCGRLSATQEALAAGQLSYWHATTIAQETSHLTDVAAQAVEDRVLPRAGGNTVAGLRRRLGRAASIVTPTSSAARARKAKAAREVTLVPGEDGMATLQAVGPAPALQAVFDVLDVVAGRTPLADTRPMGARRFDALVDAVVKTLDNAGCPGPSRIEARVHVTMDLPTLLGLRDNPAELHGYGPLPAPLARALAADNGWYRLVHDPITGAPQDLGRTRRFPSAALVDWIRIRDRVCSFPGCYRAATRCDLDHRIAAQQHGGTDKDNLAPLCPKHHRVKDTGWTYRLHPDRIVWHSPNGIVHTRHLPDPDLTIPQELEAIGDLDGVDFAPADQGFSEYEASDLPISEIEPREGDVWELEPREQEVSEFEPREGDLSELEPREQEVSEFEPREGDLSELEPREQEVSEFEPREGVFSGVEPRRSRIQADVECD
jgi:hypothetical protein